jgi:hypothetical protein
MIVRIHYSSKNKMLFKEELLEEYEKEAKIYYDHQWAVKEASKSRD